MALQYLLSNMDVVERVRFAEQDFKELKKILLKKVFPKCKELNINRDAYIGCDTDANNKGYIYIAYDIKGNKYMRLIYLEDIKSISKLYFPNGDCMSKSSKREFLQDLSYYLYMNIDLQKSKLRFSLGGFFYEVGDIAINIMHSSKQIVNSKESERNRSKRMSQKYNKKMA